MNMDNKKDTYSIGTVAALLGISPDSLRHYEKRGLISSRKQANGYRYYTNDDLRNLLCILYYRKMDISLNHMPVLLRNTSTSAEVANLLEQRILEEEETLLKHQQNIARLKMMKMQNHRTEMYQQGFSLHPFPKAYIIDECSSSQEIMFRWFQRAGETSGLDMAYFYDEFTLSDHNRVIEYTRSLLLLYEEVSDTIPKCFQLKSYPMKTDMECVCYSFSTNADLKPSEQLHKMIGWAEAHGYRPLGSCFSTHLASGKCECDKAYDMELYLPVEKK